MELLSGNLDRNSRRTEIITTELGYLWANLLQRGFLERHRGIGFCAIGDNEGASNLAANLALYVGGKGKKVAVVEASLRAPSLARVFQTTGSPGLAEFLQGKADLRDVTRLQVAPGVDLVPAGETVDPFWCFTSDQFRRVSKELLVERDLVLFDVPSLNRAPEASLVVRSIPSVVLVLEANRHRAAVVRRNVAYLRSLGTPFLGVVFTGLVHEIPRPVASLF